MSNEVEGGYSGKNDGVKIDSKEPFTPLSDEAYHRQLLLGLFATWNKYLKDEEAREKRSGLQTERMRRKGKMLAEKLDDVRTVVAMYDDFGQRIRPAEEMEKHEIMTLLLKAHVKLGEPDLPEWRKIWLNRWVKYFNYYLEDNPRGRRAYPEDEGSDIHPVTQAPWERVASWVNGGGRRVNTNSGFLTDRDESIEPD